jgi:hypothetical protein
MIRQTVTTGRMIRLMMMVMMGSQDPKPPMTNELISHLLYFVVKENGKGDC